MEKERRERPRRDIINFKLFYVTTIKRTSMGELEIKKKKRTENEKMKKKN